MNKKSLVALAILSGTSVAFAAKPAQPAQPGYFDGYASIHFADNKFDLGDSEKFSTYGGRASMSYVSTNKIGGQLDVYHSQGSQSGTELKFQDTAGHLYYRDQQYLIGAVLQKSSSGFGSVDLTSNLYGLEGQYYLNQITLGVKVGNQKIDGSYRGSCSGRFFDAEVRYFIDDNWRVGASYANNTLEGGDVQTAHWSFSTEHRLKNLPISVFAKYMNNRTKVDSGDTSKNNTLMIGASLNFGGSNSLFERDRKGATLNPVNVDRAVNLLGQSGCGDIN